MSTERPRAVPDAATAADGLTDVTAKGVIVSSMTFLSRLSGFARDVLLSHFLGAGGAADAFFVAFRIPNFFRRLFAEGAFNQAFVPVLARYKARGYEELREFIALVGGNLGLVLVLFVALGMLFSEALVTVFRAWFLERPPSVRARFRPGSHHLSIPWFHCPDGVCRGHSQHARPLCGSSLPRRYC